MLLWHGLAIWPPQFSYSDSPQVLHRFPYQNLFIFIGLGFGVCRESFGLGLASGSAWLVLPWNSDPVAMLGAPGLMPSLGCASEGGFCCYLRVPGDLRAYRVRLGIQILSLCWVPRG